MGKYLYFLEFSKSLSSQSRKLLQILENRAVA